jgi:hypothetical protein
MIQNTCPFCGTTWAAKTPDGSDVAHPLNQAPTRCPVAGYPLSSEAWAVRPPVITRLSPDAVDVTEKKLEPKSPLARMNALTAEQISDVLKFLRNTGLTVSTVHGYSEDDEDL